jgi:large subunit ribosomal protein L17
MRHHKHKNQLGVKKEHRVALMANLAAALIREGRIKTTLKKAKALRPFAEQLITLAKKGGIPNRRLAMSRVRDPAAISTLFDERVSQFTNRNGGYTRIYKLGPHRLGDAAEMALIEFVSADDPGYGSRKRGAKSRKSETAAKTAAAEGEVLEAEAAEAPVAEAEASSSPEARSEAPADPVDEVPSPDVQETEEKK